MEIGWLGSTNKLLMITAQQDLQGAVPRAPRFPVHMPLRYRCVGEDSWYEGWTENISRSGVLFRADKLLSPKTRVEMSLSLPASMTGGASAKVLCLGQIVRVRESTTGEVLPALAATIQDYQFLREGAGPETARPPMDERPMTNEE